MPFKKAPGMCCVAKESPGCRCLAPELEGPWPADVLIPAQINKEVINPIKAVGENALPPIQVKHVLTSITEHIVTLHVPGKQISIASLQSPGNCQCSLIDPGSSHGQHLWLERLKCQAGNDQPNVEVQPELCIKHWVTCEGI